MHMPEGKDTKIHCCFSSPTSWLLQRKVSASVDGNAVVSVVTNAVGVLFLLNKSQSKGRVDSG